MSRNSKTSSAAKKPKKKTWSRKYGKDPWNDPETKLELFISPDLKLKLGLAHPTTEDYLKEHRDGNS